MTKVQDIPHTATAAELIADGGNSLFYVRLDPDNLLINAKSPLSELAQAVMILGGGSGSIGPTLRISYDATHYADLTVDSTGDLTITPTGGDIKVVGNLTCPDVTYPNGSERFGVGARVSQEISTAIGALSQASYGSTAVGYSARADYSVDIAIGCSARSSGGISIGYAAQSSGYGIAIGNNANVWLLTGSIAIGVSAIATGDNQLVIGGDEAGYSKITEGYIGNGVTNATPANFRLNATGGSGSNIVGGSLTLAPGRSTGNATPSKLVLQSSVAGTSGATAQTLVDTLRVADGKLYPTNGPSYGEIFVAVDSIGAGGDSLYIGKGNTNGRMFFGAPGNAFYSLNFGNVSQPFESVPALNMRDGLYLGTDPGGHAICMYGGNMCVNLSWVEPALTDFQFWSTDNTIATMAGGSPTLRLAITHDGRIAFGQKTNAYPALKRSGAELHARLADDSDFATFRCKNLIASGGGGTTTIGPTLRISYDAGNYADLTVDATGDLTITPTGGDIRAAGNFSSSGGFPNGSERFGIGATVLNEIATAIGSNSKADYAGTSLGYGSISGTVSLAIGTQANANTSQAVAIGGGTTAAGYGSIVLGYSATANASCTGSIVIGMGVAATAANQLVIGSGNDLWKISECYIGSGVTNATPTNFRLQTTGGQGTNIVGGSLRIAPGASTGNATPSKVVIQSSVAGTSGASPQTLVDTLIVDNGKTTLSGNLSFVPDGTYDIGSATPPYNRPRSIYAYELIGSGNGVLGAYYIGIQNCCLFYNLGNGIVRLTDFNGTDFNRLMLGGSSNAYPALKRNAATLEVKLADDSNYAGLKCAVVDATYAVLARGATQYSNRSICLNEISAYAVVAQSFQIDGTERAVVYADTSGNFSITANAVSITNGSLTANNGSGANAVGTNVTIWPGKSTGNATPASVIIQSSVAGTSGTGAQVLSDTLTVQSGKVGIGAAPSSTAQVLHLNGNISTEGVSFSISPAASPATLGGYSSIAIGVSAIATGSNTAIAIGYQASCTGADSAAVGRGANASGNPSWAFGGQAVGDFSVAIGGASAGGFGSIAIGQNAYCDSPGVVIGQRTVNQYPNRMVLNAAKDFNAGTLLSLQGISDAYDRGVYAWDMVNFRTEWADTVTATRKARLKLEVADAAGSREAIRLESNGTAALLSFFGVNAVARPAAIANADGTLADLTTKFNTLLATLRTLGLLSP